jgi:hydrogenase nickel incorporation protein HypA/HybF
MHELSIARSIVDIAADAARGAGAVRVSAVRVRVGELAGVAADALRFSYDVAARGTPLEGSRLLIVAVPVAVRCPACDRTSDLPGVRRFACPACGTPTADVVRGRELEVESIEVT